MERRAATVSAIDGRRVIGYASVFIARSQDHGGFMEIVSPGAFQRSLAGNAIDPIATYQHDAAAMLGRRSSGTLRLAEDTRGLRYEIDLPDTAVGNDLRELIGRGDIKGASIGFRVPADGETWSVEGAAALRTLSAIELHEVSLTAIPAFADTTAALRSRRSRMPDIRHLGRVSRWLEICR